MNTITIPSPPGFRFVPTIWSHGWYQLVPFTYDEDRRALSRVHELHGGIVTRFTIVPNDDDTQLTVTLDALPVPLDAARQGEIIQAVRRILALDIDLEPVYAWMRDRPRYAWVERAGAGRVMVAPTLWEDLAKTLLTTNTTWAMTKQMVNRLCAMGRPYRDGQYAFPTPEQIASIPPDTFAGKVRAGYRAPYLHELASRIAEGEIDLEAWEELSSADLYKTIKALKGFGDYATGSMLRLMGRHDRLSIDTVARDVFKTHLNDGEMPTDAEIRAYYAPFGEWQGLAQWLDIMYSWFPEAQTGE
jgi:3-methyladenine DNA glycosylase/8-oxoguanine DNA glycosylase